MAAPRMSVVLQILGESAQEAVGKVDVGFILLDALAEYLSARGAFHLVTRGGGARAVEPDDVMPYVLKRYATMTERFRIDKARELSKRLSGVIALRNALVTVYHGELPTDVNPLGDEA